MKKVLAVIVPTYNMEHYLRHCLDSLVVPNMDMAEVIIVNDGSTDSSSAIAHEYEEKYPDTFRVVDKKNGNYGSCINCALPLVKSKYVKILDADDSFEKDNYNRFLSYLATTDADVVLTDYCYVNSKDNIYLKYLYSEQNRLMPEKILHFSDVYQKTSWFMLHMHGLTYRTQVFENPAYHQLEGISYTDAQWAFEPMFNVKTLVYYPVILYRYLTGRSGQTMEDQAAHIQDLMTVTLELIRFYISHQINNSPNKLFFNQAIQLELQNIYIPGLYNNAYDRNLLKNFETKLKQYPTLFEKIGNFSYHGLKIVKLWRKRGYTLPFWFPAFKVLQKVVHPFHAFIHNLLTRSH